MPFTTVNHSSGVAITSDALYRSWGSAISAAIGTVGWVQTSDTGQVNWSTVTVPSAGVYGNYEIWRCDDSLQATDPIFIKFEWSRTSSNFGLMRATVGTATDGAGTLTSAANTNTSVTAANAFIAATAVSTTVPCRSYIGGDTSSLTILHTPNVNGVSDLFGGVFAVERRRDADGTPAAGGFYAFWSASNVASGTFITQVVYTHNAYSQPGSSTTSGLCLTGRNAAGGSPSNAVRNNVVPVFPVTTGAYPEFGAPSKHLVGVYRSDVPLGGLFDVSLYGSTGTFFSLGPGWIATSATGFSNGAVAIIVPCVRVA